MNSFPKTENQTVEFKTSFNEDVIETLVAFSNAKGGTVYIGVSDKGEILGTTIGTETVQNWINEIKSKTNSQIIPDVATEVIDNKQIVLLYVQEHPIKPIAIRGRYYKRVGNSNHLLSVNEVSNMHLQTVNSSWDYYPRPNKTINDISLEKVEKVIKIINKRNENFQFDNAIEFLEKKELLLDENKITNACFLMFSKATNLFTTIQMGHFASEIVIKDDVVNEDDILTQVEEVMSFIRKHINKELIISNKQVENIQRWQYPLDGIREIVLNMIIHRDYTASTNSIIKIFPNHIQFFNPGVLPESISVEQLLSNQYISTPRNRQIAAIAKDMGLIERYGTGIKRIRNYFVEYGLEYPVYEVLSGGVSVTVYRLENLVEDTDDVPDRVPSEVPNRVPNRVTNRVTNEVTNNLTDNLTDNQKSIVWFMLQENKISTNELSINIGISKRKILNNISKLKAKGVIERTGTKTGGYWKVNKELTETGTPTGTPIDTPIGTPIGTQTGTQIDTQTGIQIDTQVDTLIDTLNITEGERKLLHLIYNNNNITREEISEQLNISINTVKKFILKLKQKGVLERVGNNKTGYWKIKNIIIKSQSL